MTEKSTGMKTHTTPFEGLQQADCGCAGNVLPAGTRLTGTNAIVSLRIVTACQDGHPERVSANCIERFAVDQFAALRPHKKAKATA